MSEFIKYIRFEAKDSKQLEEILNKQALELEIISIYALNGRHYAWCQTPLGSKKKVVRSKVKVTNNSKKTKVKL